MMTKKKRGFTIVELVIVIAVIGILAAVLIPTFTGLVEEARQSNDRQIVYFLNQSAERVDIKVAEGTVAEINTMHDAIKAMDDIEGFDITKLTPTSTKCDILWDSTANRFVLVNENGEVVACEGNHEPNMLKKENLWKVYETVPTASEGYSIYLKGAGVNTPVTVTGVGFDAGYNANIPSVKYNDGNGKNVVIRTNGGNLTIQAPNDDVHHYGYAEKVDVVDVKGTSYHENGEVDLIKVKKGHVELETEAQVLGIYVYNGTEYDEEGKVDGDPDNSFADIKITVKAGAEVPQLSRSAVSINPTTGTKVCTLVTEEAKDIYLFQQGVYEQIKTVDEGGDVTTNAGTWANDTSNNNEKTQTAAYQLANELNASFKVDDVTYTVIVNTESDARELVVTNTTNNETVTDTNIVAKAVDQSGSEESDAVADLPLKGDGLSWETAFEIYDYATMQKINDYAGQDRYFKVVIEKTDNGHIDLDNWSYIYMDGHFDGSGVIFDNLDCVLFYGPYASEQFDAKNFTISESCSISGWRTGAAVLYDGAPENHLSNITVHGYIQGSDRAAAFVGWGTYSFGTQKWYFDNCYSDATLVGSDVGGFIAHPYNNNGQKGSAYVSCYAYAYFNDSLFEGVMQTSKNPNYINGNNCSATAGSAVYMNFSNASLLSRFNAVCKTTLGTNTNGNGYTYVYGQNNSATPFNSMSDYLKRTSMETTNHTLEGMSLGDTFSASKNANATKAVITFNVGPNGKTESGNFVGTYLKDEYTSLNEETITSNNVKYYTIAVNPTGVEETGVTGTQLNIVGEQYGTTYGSASVTIAQYNSNGYLVQLDVWILPVE
jgi:type IV pilus assembly protein PilA